MKDGFGRNIDYMRISVTDRCNLRCVYCMPEEGVESIPHDRILRFSGILEICRAAVELGITRFKLTGGEPLVRKGITGLVEDLCRLPGVEEVTLTTNGVRLAEFYDQLAEAGLSSVTVSLDTLNRENYLRLSRRDELYRVLESLELAKEKGRIPLKINCVPFASSDPEDLAAVAALARDTVEAVRFIEMMPIGLGASYPCLPEDRLRECLEAHIGALTPWSGRLGNGPARYYSVEGFRGKIGFISAVTHAFCSSCNRVRLTSDGFLKSCLQYETGEDLKSALESGDREALRRAMVKGILEKPAAHSFSDRQNLAGAERRKMSQIGG